MVFSCAIGKIEFADEILLSKAKLIRDTVMAQKLNPKDNMRRLKTVDDIRKFIAEFFKEEAYLVLNIQLIPRRS